MSYKAHILKKYSLEYDSYGWFSYEQEKIRDFLEHNNIEIIDRDDVGDFWEIYVDDIENGLEDLKHHDPDDIAIRIDDTHCFTYGDIVEFLERCLEINETGDFDDDSKVYIEWY